MADLKKAADDAATRAMIAAGKDAAKRAVEDLLTSDEERAAKQAEQAPTSKARLWKIIGIGVLSLLVVVGVVGMLLTYWHWFLLAGVLGLGGLYGWSRLKKRLSAGKEPKEVEAKQVEAARAPVATAAEGLRIKEEAPRDEAEERARNARALAEARAAQEQEVDEELAAMKARLKK